MGVPDMKVPIQYALTYPRHVDSPWEQLNFLNCKDLTFQEPDYKRFPCIRLAFSALKNLGTSPTALNLSNDYAVKRFLDNEIHFTQISNINEMSMKNHKWIENPTLFDISELDNDVSAALFKDGKILGAASEERFTRIKKQAGVPKLAIKYLLN